jgi:hypothetical protein
MAPLDLADLSYLATVDRAGSLSAAARALNMMQPTFRLPAPNGWQAAGQLCATLRQQQSKDQNR